MNKQMKSAVSKIKKENKGAAMIMVLCVMAVFLALSVSLLLAASSALNTARQNYQLEQSKIQSVTFSNLIDQEIQDPDSSLCTYLKDTIASGLWSDLDTDSTAIKGYQVDETEGNYSVYFPIKLEMYWKLPDGGLKSSDDYTDIQLYVDTICVVSDQQEYRVQSRYGLKVDQEKTKDASGNEVVNDVWRWRILGRK
jgi:hypothetical protein